MAQLQDGQSVSVTYTGRLEDGSVFDSNEGRDPLTFVLGGGQIIPGFDSGVRDMNVGDTKTVTIPPEEAYGERSDENMLQIGHDQVPPNMDVQVGMQLQLQAPDGRPVPVTVADVTDEGILLDANHSLAGKTLIFDITLVSVS